MSPKNQIPELIKEKYRRGRRFRCKYKGEVMSQGEVEDCILVPHEGYLKGVEKLKFEKDGRTEFRFMYWANLGKGWKWGQFCVMLPKDKLQELFNEMLKKGWIRLP